MTPIYPQDAIYGVMYTLLKEKSGGSWKSELSDILIHFLQLYLVVLSQDVSANG